MAKTLRNENIAFTSFLDCGSGTGLLGAALLKHWPDMHVTGIDFAGDMLAQSVADGNAHRTILHDLMSEAWPVAGDSFDLVGAASVLNYAADAQKFISRMARALAPGGYLILSHLAGQDSGEGETDDGHPVYLWSGADIEQCLENSGIAPVSSRDVRTYSGRVQRRQDRITLGRKR